MERPELPLNNETSTRQSNRVRKKKKTFSPVVTEKQKGKKSSLTDAEEKLEEEEVLYCFCRKPDDGKPMIKCDSCTTWYHCKCVGLLTKTAVNAVKNCYLCQDCLGVELDKSLNFMNESTESVVFSSENGVEEDADPSSELQSLHELLDKKESIIKNQLDEIVQLKEDKIFSRRENSAHVEFLATVGTSNDKETRAKLDELTVDNTALIQKLDELEELEAPKVRKLRQEIKNVRAQVRVTPGMRRLV